MTKQQNMLMEKTKEKAEEFFLNYGFVLLGLSLALFTLQPGLGAFGVAIFGATLSLAGLNQMSKHIKNLSKIKQIVIVIGGAAFLILLNAQYSWLT